MNRIIPGLAVTLLFTAAGASLSAQNRKVEVKKGTVTVPIRLMKVIPVYPGATGAMYRLNNDSGGSTTVTYNLKAGLSGKVQRFYQKKRMAGRFKKIDGGEDGIYYQSKYRGYEINIYTMSGTTVSITITK